MHRGEKMLFRLRSQVSRRLPETDRRRHRHTPVLESLEGRQLLAASVVSAVEQFGIPSVFAIGNTGNVSYNFLTDVNGQPAWNGWTRSAVVVGAATAVSTGTVLVDPDPAAVHLHAELEQQYLL